MVSILSGVAVVSRSSLCWLEVFMPQFHVCCRARSAHEVHLHRFWRRTADMISARSCFDTFVTAVVVFLVRFPGGFEDSYRNFTCAAERATRMGRIEFCFCWRTADMSSSPKKFATVESGCGVNIKYRLTWKIYTACLCLPIEHSTLWI